MFANTNTHIPKCYEFIICSSDELCGHLVMPIPLQSNYGRRNLCFEMSVTQTQLHSMVMFILISLSGVDLWYSKNTNKTQTRFANAKKDVAPCLKGAINPKPLQLRANIWCLVIISIKVFYIFFHQNRRPSS